MHCLANSSLSKHKHTEMTYSRLLKKIAMRRKLLILRKLTNSKSVKRSSIIMDAFLYICKLKLRVEALQREYLHLMQHIKDVKVEKLGNGFLARVTCKRGPNTLLSILEAFEGMGLRVVHSKVMCHHIFCMEAIVEADHKLEEMEPSTDVSDLTRALLKAIDQNQNDAED